MFHIMFSAGQAQTQQQEVATAANGRGQEKRHCRTLELPNGTNSRPAGIAARRVSVYQRTPCLLRRRGKTLISAFSAPSPNPKNNIGDGHHPSTDAGIHLPNSRKNAATRPRDRISGPRPMCRQAADPSLKSEPWRSECARATSQFDCPVSHVVTEQNDEVLEHVAT